VFSPQLQSWVLPSPLVALAAVGFTLLRSELRNAGMPVFQRKQKADPYNSSAPKIDLERQADLTIDDLWVWRASETHAETVDRW
jgi:hypothetical protein